MDEAEGLTVEAEEEEEVMVGEEVEEDMVEAEVEDLEEAEVVDLDGVVAEVDLTDSKTTDLRSMLLVRS